VKSNYEVPYSVLLNSSRAIYWRAVSAKVRPLEIERWRAFFVKSQTPAITGSTFVILAAMLHRIGTHACKGPVIQRLKTKWPYLVGNATRSSKRGH
jgi:hypothetical protein